MVSAVARFISCGYSKERRDAMALVSALRSKEHEDIGKLLDELYMAIDSRSTSNANCILSKIIDEKRNHKVNSQN